MTTPAFAPRLSRLVAQVIDSVIGAAPIVLAALTSSLDEQVGGILLLASVIWFLLYYLFADGLGEGQSFGKRWLGIRVIGAETGAPCTYGQSFIRNFLLALLGPIDWLFIFGERHQRLGDMAAGTLVVVA